MTSGLEKRRCCMCGYKFEPFRTRAIFWSNDRKLPPGRYIESSLYVKCIGGIKETMEEMADDPTLF